MSTPDEDDAPAHRPEAMAEGEEAPPRGVALMGALRWGLLALAALAALGSWWSYARAEGDGGAAVRAPKYHCPMHPQIVSPDPGECPICHMSLELIPEERSAPPVDAGAKAPIPSPAPHADAGTRAGGARAPRDGGAPIAMPRGTAPIDLAFDRVQAIGVRTAVVSEDATSGGRRLSAVVAAPEQGVSEVHVRTAGFVEKVRVDQTGIAVGRGQALFAFFSPELLQAQQELLATQRWATDAGARTASASRAKLELLGMTSSEIDRVVASGEAVRAVTVVAPQGGYVTKKGVVNGAYVTPEMVLYEIQDLSRVYVIASVYERDVAEVRVGTTATFRPARAPDRALTAKVDLVYPSVSLEARTTRVRMQLRNDDLHLRPGDYGTVELAVAARHAVLVPRDALIDTGTDTYVFVASGDGHFVPRAVVVDGPRGDAIALEGGVEPGERVVSGATFLIDSESRLKASLAASRQREAGAP